MAAKGYTTAQLVADELGRALSAGEITQAEGLIEEAEVYVDRVTGRAWLIVSPVTAEAHVPVGPYVYLDNVPVATVTAVTIRSSAIGATETALVAGNGYELLDAERGLVTLSSYPLVDPVLNGPAYTPGTIVKVSYTFTSPSPVPADIRGVTTRMVANRMRGRLEPALAAGLAGVHSISVGQGDLDIEYGEEHAGAGPGVSEDDAAILRSYRGIVFA